MIVNFLLLESSLLDSRAKINIYTLLRSRKLIYFTCKCILSVYSLLASKIKPLLCRGAVFIRVGSNLWYKWKFLVILS